VNNRGRQDEILGRQMSNSLAELFRELHRGPRILVMPNAWDVASARLFEEAGVRAIATTSSGISVSHGYPDGQNIPADEMMAESLGSPVRCACRLRRILSPATTIQGERRARRLKRGLWG